MTTTVFCRTTAKGIQSFYAAVGNQTHFLFRQAYRVSNKAFFERGININEIGSYANVRSASVRKILDKLPSYLRYVEKEYGIAIYQKSKETKRDKKAKAYKRTPFRWQDYAWEVA